MKFKKNIGESSLQGQAEVLVADLQQQGYQAFWVGGAVRDLMLGRTPEEFDIVSSARPEQIIELYPDSNPMGAAFGIIQVHRGDYDFEVATFRQERSYLDGRHPEEVKYTDNPETDAQRRDFTINGMLYDPVAEQLRDFVGGQKDLGRGIIRTIGDPGERFAEDYLRILRAVRFAVKLGFELEEGTAAAIGKTVSGLGCLAAERIQEELNKIFGCSDPALGVRMMFELGILGEILPEITALDGVTQPEEFHPEGDVFTHTLLMLEHMVSHDSELAWAVLLHDAGKPETRSVDDQGVEHFYCHDERSAELAGKVLDRLRFSKKSRDRIVHAVRQHMRYAFVTQMRPAKWKRLMAEPTFPLELELHRLDCVSSHAKMDNYLFLLDKFRELADTPPVPPPLLTGKDLLALGMKPGPEIGRLLRLVADLQLEGEINSREKALDWIKNELAMDGGLLRF